MTAFKKCDRVQVNANCPERRFAGRYGTVAYADVYSVGVRVDDDPDFTPRNFHPAELRFVAPSSDPAPLRFSDVRTGDMITVETGEPNVTLITGIAEVNEFTGDVRIPGLDGWYWNDETTPFAKLTAHVPAEPEWHRAKVIKAGNDYLVRCASTGVFRDQQGVAWSTDELTNVTVIVDAEGQVRA